MTTAPHMTAVSDQFNAAVAEARTIIHTFATANRCAPKRVVGNPWLTKQIQAVAHAFNSGQARRCPHLGAPTVLHAAVWAPGRVTCGACVATLRPDATEDNMCDRCRKPAPELYAGLYAAGPILLQYGLCTPCARRTGLHRPNGATRR